MRVNGSFLPHQKSSHAFSKITDPQLSETIVELISDPGLEARLTLASETVNKYAGASSIASILSKSI